MQSDFVLYQQVELFKSLTVILVNKFLYYHSIGKMLLVPFSKSALFFWEFYLIVGGKAAFYMGCIQYVLAMSISFYHKILVHYLRLKF